MIALDTNILVRYIVGDDHGQARRAAALLEHELTVARPGFVSLVALVELGWVLRNVYSVSSSELRDIVRQLLNAAQLIIDRADAVEAALAHVHEDFADALIHELGKAAECSKTLTFDREFARLEGVQLLGNHGRPASI
ncbi:MAG TPA: type II toxin-antitoxin system VapC family toxin [Allosphingosinicella sp.]|nr:type II toxin-antitoxin system VapC family toxin [Allosphingosinicella sp.]